MKGISPIVAVVLLIAIAVIASVGVWYWMGTLTSKKAMPSAPGMMSIAVLGNGKLLVTNLGTTNINLTTLRTSDPHVWVTMCGNASDPVLTPGEQTICDLLTNSGLNESKTVLVYGNDTNTVQLQVNDNTADKSLVGWWSFDDVHYNGTVWIAPDDSGNGNDGVLYNGSNACTAAGSNGEPPSYCPQIVQGVRGKALHFLSDNVTKVNQKVLVLDNGELDAGTHDMSVALWIKSSPEEGGKGNYAGILWKHSGYGHNNGDYWWVREYMTSNKLQVSLSPKNGTQTFFETNEDYLTGKFNYFTSVFKRSSGIYAYKNGTYDSYVVGTKDFKNIQEGSGPLHIGDNIDGRLSSTPYQYVNETIDDVIIFNRALNDNEIKWLYKWGLPHQQ